MSYNIAVLRAVRNGLSKRQSMYVTATDHKGRTVRGTVNCIGSKLSVNNHDGRLVEDIRPEWVTHVDVTDRPGQA